MIDLTESPRLRDPTTKVRDSYLTGEQADMRARGSSPEWLKRASTDFGAFVAERTGVVERWGVPSQIFWFIADTHYLGSLVLRHRLTEDEGGGHIGYHVVYPWQRQGHATEMLRQGLDLARRTGIRRVLLTVHPDNEWSRRVVLRNGGVPAGLNHEGEERFWVALAD